MLRYLTNKLRTQSLNEERNLEEKAQEDHDSGTESDDESGDTNDFPADHNNTMEHEEDCEWGGSIGNRSGGAMFPANNSMGGRPRSRSSSYVGEDSGSDMMMVLGGSGGSTGGRDSASSQFESCYIDSALPSDSDHAYDHHSSEEELEVINNSYQDLNEEALLGDDEIRGPGSENKRKWSQVASNRLSVESTSSSDDEVQGLLRPVSTPVEFCTSPPVDAHKPSRSQSPPPKLFLFASTSPPGSISSDIITSSGLDSNGPLCLMNGHSGGVFRGLRRSDNSIGAADPLGHNNHNSPLIPNGHSNGVMNGGGSNYNALLGEGQQNGRSHHHANTTNNQHVEPTSTTGRNSRSGRDSTSRKRHRHHNPRHIQRPWLDFEKMQQLKTRSVTTWRSSGGELSLYCS